ncbi:MAG: Cys-tRNA(Pro) deacylase [Hydrogeniiclostridium sp.]
MGKNKGKHKEQGEKTNVMRMLEAEGIPYTCHFYEHGDEAVDGLSVAKSTGQNPEQVFKTLVTRGGNSFFVFVIPVAMELDLKAAARVAGVKNIEMLHVNELLKTTGYIRGGCSPIGMRKLFPTILHESCLSFDTILVSGGKIGTQVELSPSDLLRLTKGKTASVAL